MKANPDKCRLFIGTKTIESVNTGEHKIQSSSYEKLPGIKIYSQLNFHTHLNPIVKKANRKVRAVARILKRR